MDDRQTPLEAEVMELPSSSAEHEPENSYGTSAMPKPKHSYVWLWVVFGIAVIALSSFAVAATLFDVRLERRNGGWSLHMGTQVSAAPAPEIRNLPAGTAAVPETESTGAQNPLQLHVSDDTSAAPNTASEVYTAVSPSVVCLRITTAYGTADVTAVVLSADGYLLTAATDFSRANQINAIFPDGETRTAQFVRMDRASGLTILKTDADRLQPVTFAPNESARVGQTVYCVSNPFGSVMQNVFSAGMLSAVQDGSLNGQTCTLLLSSCDRQSDGYGIPLFDEAGRLLGLTVPAARWLFSGMQDPCFALSSGDIQRIVGELTARSDANEDMLGLVVEEIPANIVSYYGYPGSLWVAELRQDSPLIDYLRENDVITHVNGTRVTTEDEYRQALRDAAGLPHVTLTIYRSRMVFNVTVTLRAT